MDFTFRYDSPLGCLTLVSDGLSLTGLRFAGQALHGLCLKEMADCPNERHKYPGRAIADADELVKDRERCEGSSMLPVFADTCRWLDIYFAGRDPGFLPQLAPAGTPFRKEVWELLLGIPFGRTTSYGELAAIIASKRKVGRMSAQAIGGAVGHNPIPIIIPCHRVIAADGSIGGFSSGIERKEWLLRVEGLIS